MEGVPASFRGRNILKPDFHNCRCCAMLVDSCFGPGKIRYSHYYRCGVCTSVFHNQECPKSFISTTIEVV